MQVSIDQNSGYCFGVEFAIQMAEEELDQGNQLYCLGDIVHNAKEIERLNAKGLKSISREEMREIRDCKVLIRAHGEPPETYDIAMQNNIELVDASCPVVLKLQNRVKNAYDKSRDKNGQIVIYGKPGHAEVTGLAGQTTGEAIVVKDDEDLEKIDFTKPITLYSQTTKSTDGFYRIKSLIEQKVYEANGDTDQVQFEANDSICRQVSNREPELEKFASKHDVILFVSGKKSSNGRALHSVCCSVNERSYFVEGEEEIDLNWFNTEDSVGVCGATSTPMWLMERVADYVRNNAGKKEMISS